MSYIQREAALKAIFEHPSNIAPFTKKAIEAIKNIPTADVVEVRHGEWEEIKCGDGVFDYCFKCSNCGSTTAPKAFSVAPDYCPNCGAKMDGERRENGK